jgi:hypothetical protein
MSQPQSPSASVLEQAMLGALALALVAMLSLPAARGVSEVFGWLPLWLLALPLSAWAVARALRHRSNAEPILTKATVHAIGAVRITRIRAVLARAA